MRAGVRGWVWRIAAGLALLAAGRTGAVAQRLPGGVTPEHYALSITPDLKAASFTGVESIDLRLDAPADRITLNAVDLTFATVLGANMGVAARSPAWQTATVTENGLAQQATLHFGHALAAGPVRLQIQYSGKMDGKLRGFYISRTRTHTYGVTQFESTDARRAFPSFDEPALKATFDVTLTIDDGDTAISNTPVVSDVPAALAGKHTVAFASTPKMSTYLVAWLIGDWACSEGKSEGVRVRVCATPDKARLTRFALDAAKWDLKYYDRYFGIKYPLEKIDLVAIPDFEAGAMENFGCLTFRETELLVDAKDGAIGAKKEVTTTVAHEIAHQWLGDMVTMRWWDDLWLNEGFATWMETKAAAAWRPEWKFDDDAAVTLDATMDLDAQPSTRPIRTRVETPDEIDAIFDDIAYGKAGAVIGMMENWVGDEVFRTGVQRYVAAHKYGNATAEDFWNAETRVSGLAVDTVMRSFVEQPGIPGVKLGDVVNGRAAVSQRRFLINGEGGGSPAGEVGGWTLPLCLHGGRCTVVGPESKDIAVPVAVPLFADANDKGYYRTVYTAGQREALESRVETALTAPERIGLLSDRWALMQGGPGTVGQFLDLAMAVKDDSDATVIGVAVGKVEEVGAKIATDEQRDRLNAIVRSEYGPVYAALGPVDGHATWEQDELRSTLYQALGDAGDPDVLAAAERMTRDLLAGKRPKDFSLADASVDLTAGHGDTAMYDELLALARTASDPGVKADALHLLAGFEAPVLVIRTLDYAVGEEVRSQDSGALIALELGNRHTQELAWQYVQQHWGAISRKLTANDETQLVEATGGFCSARHRDEVTDFFAAHPVTSERTLDEALASIDGCVRLRETQRPELNRWLDAHRGL